MVLVLLVELLVVLLVQFLWCCNWRWWCSWVADVGGVGVGLQLSSLRLK